MAGGPVAVLCGGHPSEHDISLLSGAALVGALRRAGRRVIPVLIAEDRRWNVLGELGPAADAAAPTWPERVPGAHAGAVFAGDSLAAAGQLREAGVRVVLPALHGADGEDGSIQGFLRVAGFAVAGCGVGASAVAVDKVVFKRVLRDAGLPTPDFVAASARDLAEPERRTRLAARIREFGRTVVKPVALGSSVGIGLAADEAGAFAALEAALAVGRQALVERFVEGLELTCGVHGDADDPKALPVVEIRPKLASWFDLASKYQPGGADEIVPARIPEATAGTVRELACRCHGLIGATGLSRTDFILAPEGTCWILEINTLPGMTAASLFPKALAAAGIAMESFADALVRAAGSPDA